MTGNLSGMSQPINVFVIYAREDKSTKLGLLRHLKPLSEPYDLNIWHDEYIDPGQEWKPSIESRLAQTDLFLLLISADFMNSEFIHQVEFKFAIEQHKLNKAIVIPIIIDYCIWDIDIRLQEQVFNLGSLQVLPDGGKPIGDWKTAEQAYHNIAAGVRKVLTVLKNKRGGQVNIAHSVNTESISETGTNADDKKTFIANQEPDLKTSSPKTEETQTLELQNPEAILSDLQNESPYQEITLVRKSKKKILYGILIVACAVIAGYFLFRDTSGETESSFPPSGQTNRDTAVGEVITESKDTNSNKPPSIVGDESNTSPTPDHESPTENVPINTFNKFPEAFAAVLRNAPNDFTSLKGEFNGTENGARKYKSKLTIRDKSFREPAILEDGYGTRFVFTNSDPSHVASINTAVEAALKKKNIKYEPESSSSMGFTWYRWASDRYEISVSDGKTTNGVIEIAISHKK